MKEEIISIAVAFGTFPIDSGAGTRSNVYAKAFEAWEDTIFDSFTDIEGVEAATGWEAVEIPKGSIVVFPFNVKSFTIGSGGRGQVYRYKGV